MKFEGLGMGLQKIIDSRRFEGFELNEEQMIAFEELEKAMKLTPEEKKKHYEALCNHLDGGDDWGLNRLKDMEFPKGIFQGEAKKSECL